MSYLTHINRHDDLNFNEDFEEAIARNLKEEDFENNDSETEGIIFCFQSNIAIIYLFLLFYSLFPLYFRFSNL